MRAGHAFSVSLEMIHREFQEPLAGEFRRTFEEHNLGLPLDVALQKLAKRIPSLDVHFFVSAVLLQKRTGGNLAEILDKLAYVIRERFKLRGRIRAISAHGRMTGIALTCIPLGVGAIMSYVNPEYAEFFSTDEELGVLRVDVEHDGPNPERNARQGDAGHASVGADGANPAAQLETLPNHICQLVENLGEIAARSLLQQHRGHK